MGGNGSNTQNAIADKDTVRQAEITEINEQSNTGEQNVVAETDNSSSPYEGTESKEETPENAIMLFTDKLDANSDEKLVFVEDFTPSDKESGHYRTEFRLAAYSEAIGKSYLFGNATVDIVASKTVFGEVKYRVYMNAETLGQVISMVKVASPIMDEAMTSEELQNTVDYLSENKSANGYYYGELGMVLLGNGNGYELILKMGND